jgi:hypothetical protein
MAPRKKKGQQTILGSPQLKRAMAQKQQQYFGKQRITEHLTVAVAVVVVVIAFVGGGSSARF